MNRVLVFLTLLLVSACTYGAREADFARPGGEIVTLDLGAGEVGGELLAVRADGLVLRTDALIEVPWVMIRSASFERIGPIRWPERSKPAPDALERLRLVSRFPQGLDIDLSRRLLDAYGQEAFHSCWATTERVDCRGTR